MGCRCNTPKFFLFSNQGLANVEQQGLIGNSSLTLQNFLYGGPGRTTGIRSMIRIAEVMPTIRH
jgi:hypothetical protein